MEASVIICTRNRSGHLHRTLDSLADVSVPADWRAELLLVDNGSTDDTLSVVDSFEHPSMDIRVLQVPEPGKSKALNRAVEEARGEALLLTDDDVRFPKQWIEGMCRPILNDEADAVAGGVKLASSIQADWMEVRHRELLASTERIPAQDPDQFIGANVAIGRHVFDHIPQFDPKLGGGQLGNGEDTLFARQMLEAGFTITPRFDVAVEHHPDRSRISREGFCQMAEGRGRSQGHINYHWRHQTEWSVLSLLAGLVYFGTRLVWWRIRNWRTVRDRQKISTEEFDLMRRFYRVRQRLLEHGRTPKYPPRGLSPRTERVLEE